MQKRIIVNSLEEVQTSAGFITLIGVPNSGKSTFLNRVVNQKIAIVSPKVQTTRSKILGILNSNSSQWLPPNIYAR